MGRRKRRSQRACRRPLPRRRPGSVPHPGTGIRPHRGLPTRGGSFPIRPGSTRPERAGRPRCHGVRRDPLPRSSMTWKSTVVFPARRGPTSPTVSGDRRNGPSRPVTSRRIPERRGAEPQRFQRSRMARISFMIPGRSRPGGNRIGFRRQDQDRHIGCVRHDCFRQRNSGPRGFDRGHDVKVPVHFVEGNSSFM